MTMTKGMKTIDAIIINAYTGDETTISEIMWDLKMCFPTLKCYSSQDMIRYTELLDFEYWIYENDDLCDRIVNRIEESEKPASVMAKEFNIHINCGEVDEAMKLVNEHPEIKPLIGWDDNLELEKVDDFLLENIDPDDLDLDL